MVEPGSLVVSARWEGGWRSRGSMRQFEIMVDEPAEHGGTDSGPTPAEAFLASLATCFSLAVCFVARQRSIALPNLEVRSGATTVARAFTASSSRLRPTIRSRNSKPSSPPPCATAGSRRRWHTSQRSNTGSRSLLRVTITADCCTTSIDPRPVSDCAEAERPPSRARPGGPPHLAEGAERRQAHRAIGEDLPGPAGVEGGAGTRTDASRTTAAGAPPVSRSSKVHRMTTRQLQHLDVAGDLVARAHRSTERPVDVQEDTSPAAAGSRPPRRSAARTSLHPGRRGRRSASRPQRARGGAGGRGRPSSRMASRCRAAC